MISSLLSPSVKFKLRSLTAGLWKLTKLLRIWRWEIIRFPLRDDCNFCIRFIGQIESRETVKALLGIKGTGYICNTKTQALGRTVHVAELPFPGSLKVPCMLGTVVPLDRTIDEITSGFHSQLRREIRKNSELYRFRQILKDEDIEKANHELLQPYAKARHGDSACQLTFKDVLKMAQNYGRLDLLTLGEEVVGCQLGCEITRANKRYWSTNRCGYTEAVFSDSKRLREANAINIHLSLVWALNNGFNFYDIGTSLGRPDDGLLEWKRRRGGVLDTLGNDDYVYIKLPKVGVTQFLWDAPLFAVEGDKITLHLGLPYDRSDADIASRYREMGFGGLSKVYLHCNKSPDSVLLNKLCSYFENQKSTPVLKIKIHAANNITNNA